MNNIILGGAGFIGQNLSHKLLRTRQERVTLIDNLKTSNINLDDFSEYKNLFEFIEADITKMDDNDLLRLFRKNHRIFHLAGSVGVEYIDKYPSETLFNNIELNNKLLPLFEKVKRHVVFSSTSEIYGEGPFSEESNASIGPSSKLRWGYATSKLMMEFMIRASNFPYTIVRFFNVVGPGQLADYGMVLPKFVQSAKSNEDLIIYGTGQQIRCFCHIDDAMNALIKVSSIGGEMFNIGNDIPITIDDLAKRVVEITNSKSKIIYTPYESAFSKNHGDIKFRIPDLTKIKKYINYSPTKNIDDIIRDML